MITAKKQTKAKQFINKNTIEALSDIPKGVAISAVKGVQGLGKGAFEQFLGLGEYNSNEPAKKGELQEGQELNLSNVRQNQDLEKAPMLDIDPGIDYRREILHAERKISQESTKELSVKIQEIIIELKQLMNVSQELKVEFKEIAVEPQIANPGKYHVSFFEWVLLIVKQARMKVEDSQAWLAAFKSKKAKRQYWSMFKKHGTTFGLSNERVVSTQTG